MNCLLIGIVSFISFIIALSVHEYCHALVAYLQGDETAARAGRMTLNPLAHLDPVGTVLIPLIGMISGLPVFGWAKPVPFNPYNVQRGKWGAVFIALAGPGSNFLSAIVFLIVLRILLAVGLPANNLLALFLVSLAMVNTFLGIFNFIPLPPLDGSKLINAIFDAPKYRNFRMFLETRGPLILILLLILDYMSPYAPLSRAFFGILNGIFALVGLPGALNLLFLC